MMRGSSELALLAKAKCLQVLGSSCRQRVRLRQIGRNSQDSRSELCGYDTVSCIVRAC